MRVIKNKYSKDCFAEKNALLINGEYFSAPCLPEKLLSVWYGDYMKLPDEDKRIPFHIDDIKNIKVYENNRLIECPEED